MVEDECGYRFYITMTNYKKTNIYKRNIFDPKNEYIIYNLNIYFSKNNIPLTCREQVIKEVVTRKGTVKRGVEIKCNCENEFETTIESLLGNKTYSCPICSKKQSKLESKVETELKRMNKVFKKQIKFNDCKNKRALPFDFAVYDKVNGNILSLIEVDGQQHFKPTRFNGIDDNRATATYLYTRKNDEIKNCYCKMNNIKLIRISYIDIMNNEYKNILINNFCD